MFNDLRSVWNRGDNIDKGVLSLIAFCIFLLLFGISVVIPYSIYHNRKTMNESIEYCQSKNMEYVVIGKSSFCVKMDGALFKIK